jgi:voltage-gated potassium channel
MVKEKVLSYINPNSLLLLCLILMVFFVPMIEVIDNDLAYQILFSCIFLLSALSLRNHRRNRSITVAACLIMFHWAAYIINLPELSLLRRILQGFVFLYVVIQLISQTASAKEVSPTIIADSISGYLLVGIIYTIVAFSIANSQSNAFNFPNGTGFDQVTGMSKMFYYTFVTYSSTGYGDITPAIPSARSLSTLISVTGQMYVAIIIALLVGKFSSKN